MTMTLYHGEPIGPSFSVLTALEETGVQLERCRIDLAAMGRHRQPWSTATEVAMSIEGEGPVLVVDGEAMADSVFIACYLDDVATGAKLRPADPYVRWQVMTWCRQIIERLAPAAALLGCQSHARHAVAAMTEAEYLDGLRHIVSEDLRARWEMCRNGSFEDGQVEDSRAKVIQAVAKCEAQLVARQWLFDDFSIADIETFAWLAGMPTIVPEAFLQAPRTTAWMARLTARPAVQRVLETATVASPEQYWAPGPEINRWG